MAQRPRERFAAILGHRFHRPELLDQALTHPSIADLDARRPGAYERLEFLGDRVLGLVVTEALLGRFPDSSAGELARRYNALVCREALVRVAGDIDLGAYLELGKSERDMGGREKPGLLADACETVIGALYLDGGFEAAAGFIRRHWQDMIAELARPPKDAKSRLQEWAQGLGKPLPTYRMIRREGPPHAPRFTVEAAVEGLAPHVASGPSKRAAELRAAEAVLAALIKAGELADE